MNDSQLTDLFDIRRDFGFKKLKALKQDLNDNYSWINGRSKELDQYYTNLSFKKQEIELLKSHGIKTIYDVCCGCLSIVDGSLTYYGNDIDPNVSVDGSSHLDTFKTPINDLLKQMKKVGPVHYGNSSDGFDCISTNPPFSKQKNVHNKKVPPLDYLYDSWLKETDIPYLGIWWPKIT